MYSNSQDSLDFNDLIGIKTFDEEAKHISISDQAVEKAEQISSIQFTKAIEKGNFKKVEHIFKKQIKKYRKGFQYDNGPGSGIQTTYTPSFDSLVNWLKLHKGVEDATWDKCQIKLEVYTGYSIVGAVFKTKKGVVEKCFLIRKITTGNVHIFCWYPHIFKYKNKLVYEEMSSCNGFVKEQKNLCNK